MKHTKYFLGFSRLFVLLYASSTAVVAQNTDLAIGEWQTHNAYLSATAVTQSSTHIYYATTQSIVKIEKSSNEISYITRVNGLNDVDIAKIGYNTATEKLLIAYRNGNLDVIDRKGKISNISDILRATISGTRDINHIYNYQNTAYLSCSFGLVAFDMATLTVENSTFTPERLAMRCAVQRDTVWLATSKGLVWCPPNRNIQNFGVWSSVADGFDGVRGGVPSAHVLPFQNTLVAAVNDSLFILKNRTWTFFYNDESTAHELNSVESTPNFLAVIAHSGTGGDFMSEAYPSGYKFRHYTDYVNNTSGIATETIGTDSVRVWVADIWQGMSNYDLRKYSGKPFRFNSPTSNRTRRSVIHPETKDFWMVAGAIDANYNYTINGDGIARYSGGTWYRYNSSTNTDLANVVDAVTIAVRPSDGHVFTGMYASNNRPFLLEMDKAGNFIKMYDRNSNTTLQAATGDPTSIRVSSIAFDKSNNLWLVNRGAPNPLSVLRPDGTWKVFSLPTSSLKDITIDDNDIKWISGEAGLIAFDDGDLDKNGDERTKVLSSANAELGNSNTITTATDLDGNLWATTTEGASVFSCGTTIFNDNTTCKGSKPLACINSVCENLLERSIVNCVATDGANRKWFGTSNGIFVQSADGRTTLAQFNTDNAPMPSNDIENITIEQENGVVWISTGDGLVSYRSTATAAPKVPVNEGIVVFPNPVRPEYNGTIAISGLARDGSIKITDVSGLLMYETTALGGQAVWNGRDYNGTRAATGVYLVYSANSDGEQALVAKIAIIN